MADESEKNDQTTDKEPGGEAQQPFTASGVPRRKKRPATLDLEATEIKTSADDTTGSASADPEAATKDDAGAPPQPGEAALRGDAASAPDEPGASSASAPGSGKRDSGSGSRNTPEAAAIAARPAGAGALLGAALLGGLVCIGAVVALAYFGLLPQQAVDNTALEQRLAQLDARLSQPVAAPDIGPQLGNVEAQLQALAERLKASEATASTIAALSDQVRAAEAAANQARDQMASLGETLSTMGDGGGNAAAAIASLGQQIATLKEEMANLAKSSTAQADMAAKTAELELLRKRVGELEQAPRDDIAAARGAAAATAASALSLAALERAVLEGRPYASELEAAAALSGDNPAFGILERHAAKGVPSHAMLAAEFETLASEIVKADIPTNEASVFAKVIERASSLVQIRPVGYVDGDTTAAAVARAEVSLQEGDLEGALSELGMLKGAARAVAGAFIARAEARLAVERAIAGLNSDALARLGDIGAAAGEAGPQGNETGANGAQSQ